MPRFKKATYSVRNGAGAVERLDVEISISTSGEFYAHIPSHLAPLANGIDGVYLQYGKGKTPEHVKINSATLEGLEKAIQKALTAFTQPEVTEEPVIRYNLESHVSFAEDEDGNIFPNAGFPGAKLLGEEKSKMYGNHYAQRPSDGGYSLTIGAMALLKRTTKYGEHVKVEYSRWNNGGSHLKSDNPANLLNSWCSMTLGKNPKEIPYTDEAALFFHNLLLGMATISRQIQEATFTQDRLLALIAKQSNTLLLANVATGK